MGNEQGKGERGEQEARSEKGKETSKWRPPSSESSRYERRSGEFSKKMNDARSYQSSEKSADGSLSYGLGSGSRSHSDPSVPKWRPSSGKGKGKGKGRNSDHHESDQHDGYNGDDFSSITSFAGTPSMHITQYWSKLSHLPLNTKAFSFSVKDHEVELWQGAWKVASGGVEGNTLCLLLLYNQLPDIELTSPRIEHVVGVICLILEHPEKVLKYSRHHSPIGILELILKVLCDRVVPKKKQIYDVSAILEKKLSNLVNLQIAECFKLNPDMARISVLLNGVQSIQTFEKELRLQGDRPPPKTRSSTHIGAESASDVAPWKGWMGKPKLEWLMSGDWHVVEPLHNVYASPTEYSETLLRMWVLLTFQWGAASLRPKCNAKFGSAKGGGKGASEKGVCGKPLLEVCEHGTCRTPQCKNPAAWKCHHYNHEAVCNQCSSRHQKNLCGRPGQQASTDIYDAVVDKEEIREDGTIYLLSSLTSRKPPKIPPNWRTSYRLKFNAFVAIVKLDHGGEELIKSHDVQWAEVSCFDLRDGSRNDFKFREEGKMAIRILTKSDCESLVGEADCPLEVGGRVAIIDMRVFVPEVISVLNTFSQPGFESEMSRIPFIKSLIGKHVKNDYLPTQQLKRDNKNDEGCLQLPPSLTNGIVTDTSANQADIVRRSMSISPSAEELTHTAAIHAAIFGSDIPFLKKLDDGQKNILVEKLVSIPAIRSLSGTQLDAFAAALASSVHCCQGPPGTGKSYLGVCLVLALSVIKREVEAGSQGLAKLGPIVVLSYKNHALDEFLCDILDNRQKTSSSTGLRALSPGGLIRSGNPDNERLRDFTERKRPEEKEAEKALSRCISTSRKARNVAIDWVNCANHLDSDLTSSPWVPPRKLRRIDPLENGDGGDASSYVSHALKDETNYTSGAILCCVAFLKHLHFLYESKDDEEDEISSIQAFRTISKFGIESYKVSTEQRYFEKDFGKLFEDLGYWCSSSHEDDVDQINFQIAEFIQGSTPPARCAATFTNSSMNKEVQRCLNCVASPNSKFCSEIHQCGFLKCFESRLDSSSKFCSAHRCSSNFKDGSRCTKDISKESVQFCTDHMCLRCASSGGKVESKLSCSLHKCQFLNCELTAIEPHQYCQDHCCEQCVATGNVPILPRTAPSSSFCLNHECCIDGCEKNVTTDQCKSCINHTCVLCVAAHPDQHPKPVSSNFPDSHLCEEHVCQEPKCELPVMLNQSLFCQSHSCRVCLEENSQCFSPAIAAHPRNTCTSHLLCNRVFKDGKLCNEVCQDQQNDYCDKHLNEDSSDDDETHGSLSASIPSQSSKKKLEIIEDSQLGDGFCCAMKKRGGRCKAKGYNSINPKKKFYCRDHITQEVEDDDDEEEEEDEEEDSDSDSFYDAVGGEEVENEHEKAAKKADKELVLQHFKVFENDMKAHMKKETVSFHFVKCVDCSNMSYEHSKTKTWTCYLHSNKKVSSLHANVGSSAEDSLKLLKVPNSKSKTKKGKKKHLNLKSGLESEDQSNLPDLIIEEEAPDAGAYGMGVDEQVSNDIDTISGIVVSAQSISSNPTESIVVTKTSSEAAVSTTSKEAVVDGGGGYGSDCDDNLQHLRDITDDIDKYRKDSDEEDDFYDNEESHSQNIEGDDTDKTASLDDFDIAKMLQEVKDWSWDMNTADRIKSIVKLLRCASYHMKLSRRFSNKHVDSARTKSFQAKGIAYRRAEIIGATVVGASKRLEAIRAAEPFAIVVEEACEVMEPTLMSVLAVKSLEKLELVGDHRQLPAFIQDYWYDVGMSQPSIKTSLFERLVMGGDTGYGKRKSNKNKTAELSERLECTVLDEQRRMIAEIADITRPEYEDLVEIKDHACCHTQRIGNRYLESLNSLGKSVKSLASAFQSLRMTWAGQGREVPGVPASVYFWNLKGNKESAPVAGLSSCNLMEAEAVTSLCKWFISMGVPRSAISVITPYKGQKTMIIKELRSAKLLPYSTPKQNSMTHQGKGYPTSDELVETDNIIVSTVDRYQGDENDIVILSLVKTSPGNAFVSLPNRYVVGTSRARLGFYIVGTTEAVANTGKNLHWQKCIDSLKCQPCSEGETSLGGGGDISRSNTSRIGNHFPLCCPVHRHETRIDVAKSGDFPKLDSQWSSFCKIPCTTILGRCGHQCGLLCHYNEPSKHNIKCLENLKRPCTHHSNVALPCHLYSKMSRQSNEDANEAIKRGFECEVLTELKREECNHVVSLQCHEKEKAISGERPLSPCEEKVTDYMHPSCDHIFKNMTCNQKQRFEASPPRCKVVLDKELGCHHHTKLMCYELIENPQRLEELKNDCKEEVELQRPRCFHSFSSRCHVRCKLESFWESEYGQSAELVEGKEKATVRVEFGKKYGRAESCFSDLLKVSIPSCQSEVEYIRKCGHIERGIKCCSAFDYAANDEEGIPNCEEHVEVDCPFCEHSIQIPCKFKELISKIAPYQNIEGDHDACGKVLVSESDFDKFDLNLRLLNNRFTRMLQKQCTNSISLKRVCGDVEQMKCSKLVAVLLKQDVLSKCETRKTKQLPCGHEVEIKCFQRNFAPNKFSCKQLVNEDYTFPCGLHTISPGTCSKLTHLRTEKPKCPNFVHAKLPRCGHMLKVSCMDKYEAEHGVTVRSDALQRMCESNHRLARLAREDTRDLYVVSFKGEYDIENDHNKKCEEKVMYEFSCGHYSPHPVKCCEAFQWAQNHDLEPKCCEKETLSHPVCNHDLEVSCSTKQAISNWNPWQAYHTSNKQDEIPKLQTETETIDLRGNPVEIVFVNEFQGDKPKDVIPSKYSKECACMEKVIYKRACHHEQPGVLCSEVFFGNVSSCKELVSMPCPKGIPEHEKQVLCHIASKQRSSSQYDLCRGKTLKLCTVCLVNKTETECHKEDVECSALVTYSLPCGHEVSWLCGAQEDPREGSYHCRQCVVPLWDKALQYNPSDDVKRDFIVRCKTRVKNAFQELNLKLVGNESDDFFENAATSKVDSEHHMKRLNQHFGARNRIMKIHKDLMPALPVQEVKPPPACVGHSQDDMNHYHLVFIETAAAVQSGKKNKNKSSEGKLNYEYYSQPQDSDFGRGVFFKDLNEENIRNINSKSTELNLLVGVAFRHNLIEEASPFSAKKKGKKNQKTKMAEEINQKAEAQKKKGYDCISSSKKIDKGKVLYWYPRAVFPLGFVQVTVNQQCLACSQLFPSTSSYTCSNKHSICWDCLVSYIDSNICMPSNKRNMDVVSSGELKLKCACVDCDQYYTVDSVKDNKAAFESITKLHSTIQSEHLTKVALVHEKQKLIADFEKIHSIKNTSLRMAHAIKQDITLQILSSESIDNGEKSKLIDKKLSEESDDMVAAIAFKLILEESVLSKDIHLQFMPKKDKDEVDRHLNTTDITDGGLSWLSSTAVNNRVEFGLRVYTLKDKVIGADVSKEALEFNMASGHFRRLLKNATVNISQIDVLEYDESAPVRKAYESEKANFPPKENDPSSKEIWVFHGTQYENVDKIINGGFKVGGEEDVSVKNGARFGRGVYTAVGPNTPMQYAQGGKCVILSRGLLCGKQGHTMPERNDYVIFKRKTQLLPSYVVYYSSVGNAL